MTPTLTLAQARRIALAAQGFTAPLPAGAITARHLRRVIDRIGVLQIDSVNVLQRAHYLPIYSRLGPYPTALLDRAAYRKPRRLFEYWGHAASYLPVEMHPLMRWRMRRDHAWAEIDRVREARPELIDEVRAEVAKKGPLTAAQIEEDVVRPTGNWGWNWTDVKIVLEHLFTHGEVLVSGRNSGFARLYDIPERVLPPEILAVPDPSDRQAHAALIGLAGRALGVATDIHLRDYFRQPVEGARGGIRDAVDAGVLLPVEIAGAKGRWFRHRDAVLPRSVRAATLLSPFDPLIWHRERTETLFDFFYRIEIYVPEHKRVHGYYVLPFLLGDRLVARVDLKADRKAGVLRVPGAFASSFAPERTAAALATELVRLAGWLGLTSVAPPESGDLAPALRAALSATPVPVPVTAQPGPEGVLDDQARIMAPETAVP